MSSDIKPEQITGIIDTREQCPLTLPFRTETATLATGDYSVKGLEHVITVERKSCSDLLGCIGGDRERFGRELQRMLGYPVRAVVVEATWADLEAGNWQSKVSPASAMGSVLGWMTMGIPFVFAGDHAGAGRAVSRMLFIAARRRWRENQSLINTISNHEGPSA